MNNPMQFIMQMMSGNPMGNIQNFAGQNPLMKQAMNMVQGNSTDNLPNVAANLCKQKGLDYDQFSGMFKGMLNQFGMKPPF